MNVPHFCAFSFFLHDGRYIDFDSHYIPTKFTHEEQDYGINEEND